MYIVLRFSSTLCLIIVNLLCLGILMLIAELLARAKRARAEQHN